MDEDVGHLAPWALLVFCRSRREGATSQWLSRLPDELAQDIMDRLFDLDDRMTKLRQRYFRRIKREASATVALGFKQRDRRIINLIEIQLAQEIPLAH